RDGVLRKLRRGREHEDRLGIDEALDQPRRGDTVDVRAGAGDPPPAAKLGQVEARRLGGTWRFRTSSAHGDNLLETPDLGAAGGVEEVDLTDTSMFFRKARNLVGHARPRGLRFSVEVLEHLPVTHGELAEVPIT